MLTPSTRDYPLYSGNNVDKLKRILWNYTAGTFNRKSPRHQHCMRRSCTGTQMYAKKKKLSWPELEHRKLSHHERPGIQSCDHLPSRLTPHPLGYHGNTHSRRSNLSCLGVKNLGSLVIESSKVAHKSWQKLMDTHTHVTGTAHQAWKWRIEEGWEWEGGGGGWETGGSNRSAVMDESLNGAVVSLKGSTDNTCCIAMVESKYLWPHHNTTRHTSWSVPSNPLAAQQSPQHKPFRHAPSLPVVYCVGLNTQVHLSPVILATRNRTKWRKFWPGIRKYLVHTPLKCTPDSILTNHFKLPLWGQERPVTSHL